MFKTCILRPQLPSLPSLLRMTRFVLIAKGGGDYGRMSLLNATQTQGLGSTQPDLEVWFTNHSSKPSTLDQPES